MVNYVCMSNFSLSSCDLLLQALSWCPWQSSLLATGGGSADKSICIWNACNGQLKCQTKTESQVSGLIWCQHHHELLSSHGNPSNKLNIWKLDQSSEEKDSLIQVSVVQILIAKTQVAELLSLSACYGFAQLWSNIF